MADKLSIKGLAVAFGALWSFYVTTAGWAAAFGWPLEFVQAFGTMYIGYAPGFVGGIIGGIWAFFDGAVAGAIIACVYNWAIKPRKRKR